MVVSLGEVYDKYSAALDHGVRRSVGPDLFRFKISLAVGDEIVAEQEPLRYPRELIAATLLRRYKRFLADVELAGGSVLTVHCPNPGRMTSCSEPGRPVWISDSASGASVGAPSARRNRKLRYTLEMIRMGRTWVGVNPVQANPVVASFIRRGRIPELAGYGEIRPEVSVGNSRIDLLLRDGDGGRPDCYVEIKNATLRAGEHAAFPEAVTERGRKHLGELATLVAAGHRGVIFYFVGRADCRRFRPADEVDPAYGAALREAVAAGVEALAYRMRFSRRRIELKGRLPIDL